MFYLNFMNAAIKETFNQKVALLSGSYDEDSGLPLEHSLESKT